jgi:hypothetical protein
VSPQYSCHGTAWGKPDTWNIKWCFITLYQLLVLLKARISAVLLPWHRLRVLGHMKHKISGV